MPRQQYPLRRRFHASQRRGRRRPRGSAAGAVGFSQSQQPQGRLGGHRKRAQRGTSQRARDDVTLRNGREAGAFGSARSQDPRRDPGRGHRDRACQEDIGRRNAPAIKARMSRPSGRNAAVRHARASKDRAPESTRDIHASEENKTRAKEELLEFNGTVTEVLPDGNYRVTLDNEHVILAYMSGKMRKFRIRTGVGDRVVVEVSPYDLTRGRINFRHKDESAGPAPARRPNCRR